MTTVVNDVQAGCLQRVGAGMVPTEVQRRQYAILVMRGLLTRQVINGHVTPWVLLTDEGRAWLSSFDRTRRQRVTS